MKTTLLPPLFTLGAWTACAAPATEAGSTAPVEKSGPVLRLPSLVGDHMVLQRERDARVWGWARPGAEVEVLASWRSVPERTRAATDGRWLVTLRTPGAGGPYTLEVRSAGETRRVEDVLVGEVWLGSGQSNMEMPVGDVGPGYAGVGNWREELARADRPRIRLFTVENRVSARPEEDCVGEWSVANAESVRTFSATAWFFGCELERELDVPIGLIASDWGGTPAEAWMSFDALARHGGFDAEIAQVRRERDSPGLLEREAADARQSWWRELDRRVPYAFVERVPAAAWRDQAVPGTWKDELGAFDGVVVYRTHVALPDEWTGQELLLELGAIDDLDTVWFDGVRVGETHAPGHWNLPREYAIPGDRVERARPDHELVVRVVDTGGLGGMAGDSSTFRIRARSAPSPARVIAGTWQVCKGPALAELASFPQVRGLESWMAATLHSGMLMPLANLRLAGVIWYQGEANLERWREYRTLLPALIADWRACFDAPELAFHVVQIAPFGYAGDRGEAARLREAQLHAARACGAGLAVTMDIGNRANIHPVNKQEVGRRLALCALRRTYGRPVHDSGPDEPFLASVGGELVVSFFHAHGLALRGASEKLFQVAGSDLVFHPARARVEGETLIVSSPEVPDPVHVRYAFGAADEGVLFNAAGLPASSFRTDDSDTELEPR